MEIYIVQLNRQSSARGLMSRHERSAFLLLCFCTCDGLHHLYLFTLGLYATAEISRKDPYCEDESEMRGSGSVLTYAKILALWVIKIDI